jgi:hypothetical protein
VLPVSGNFLAAENADVNQPLQKVYLVLGDLFTSNASNAIATHGDQPNYPALGVINGDHTELNVGPAVGSYDGVGQSSWRGTLHPPTVGVPEYLSIFFSASFTFNRIKLYHLNGHGIDKFGLYWSNNYIQNVLIACTNNFSLVGDFSVTFNTTGTLDVIDFPDVTQADRFYIRIEGTQVGGDYANIVEIEAYRVVDITSRVRGVQLGKGRDYKLANPIASEVTLILDNTDKYFSFDYRPSSEEIAEGFINTYLKPAVGVVIKNGFGTEFVTLFTGTIDRLTINPNSRTAEIKARDALKHLLNQTISCKLKSSTDIGNLIVYVLNICGFSSYEITADLTAIVIDYFYTDNEFAIDTIRKLVQACGDAVFYFDESGRAIFYNYMNNVQQQALYTAEADFERCSLTNIDTTSAPGQIQQRWILLEDWTTGNRDGSGWTYAGYSTHNTTAGDGGMVLNPTYVGSFRTTSNKAIGTWHARFPIYTSALSWKFMDLDPFTQYTIGHGYYISMGGTSNYIFLSRGDGATRTIIGQWNYSPDTAWHDYRITRDANGIIIVYRDGTAIITATDNTYTTCAYYGFQTGDANQYIGKLYYSNAVLTGTEAISTATPYLLSDTIDQSANLTAEQLFQSYFVTYGGSVTFQTRTSPNGSTWNSFTTVTNGQTIPSTMQRYLQWNATLVTTTNILFGFALSTVYDVELNWLTGAGRAKYPVTVSKTISDKSVLMNISQDYTDELAGDTAIFNYVKVQAQPLILTGNSQVVCTGTINSGSTSMTVNTTNGLTVGDRISIAGVTGAKIISTIVGLVVTIDTPADANAVTANVIVLDIQWQGTVGTPPAPISPLSPFLMTNGTTYTFQIIPSAPIDTSQMSGASPLCVLIRFGSGSATYSFTYISPTEPILQIVCTGSGTITNLQIVEKHFENNNTILAKIESDKSSINSYGLRSLELSNEFIVNPNFADSIANYYLRYFKSPISYISNCLIRPTYSLQIGDRVTVSEDNTNLNNDYIVIGMTHVYSLTQIGTTLKLMLITI